MIETNDRRVATVVDTSTIGIKAARQVHGRLGDARIEYVDAPISGGTAGAAAATIAVMFAGSEATYERLQDVLGSMSGSLFHVGSEPGQGQAMKVLNNFLSATAMAATSEALSFGTAQGLEMKLMLDVLNASSGQNTATSDKFPKRILPEKYDAGFTNTLLVKDISLYLDSVHESGTADAAGNMVVEIWRRFLEAALGDDITRIYPFIRDQG